MDAATSGAAVKVMPQRTNELVVFIIKDQNRPTGSQFWSVPKDVKQLRGYDQDLLKAPRAGNSKSVCRASDNPSTFDKFVVECLTRLFLIHITEPQRKRGDDDGE